MPYLLLSYPLAGNAPAPGGRKALEIFGDESVKDGFPGNTYYYKAWNHAGTHIDAPAHMIDGAKRITDFSIADFVFTQPVVVDIPKHDNQLITAADLQLHESAIAESELLLIRTGFSKWRTSEPLRYRDFNPGLSVEAARYLVQQRFSRLRAIAIDAISMASPAHLEEGIEAHKILFTRRDDPPILLIEDASLEGELACLKQVMVVPLFIEGLDSCPCTIIAEIKA